MTGPLRVRLDGRDLSGGASDGNDIQSACGDDLAWGIAVPWTFRALAAPRSCAVMPAAPEPGAEAPAAAAYWAPIMHLLAYSMAWTRPARGLYWWYSAGKPVDDPRLSLIADVWDADGQLDWFTIWMWDNDPDWRPFFQEVLDVFAPEHDLPRPSFDAAWVSNARHRAEHSNVPNPLAGGSDPLHLGSHWNGPLTETPGSSVLQHSSPAERAAVLTVDGISGWYRQLATRGQDLPKLSDRSWRVEVVAKSAAWLGTYRRSRQTGLWFSGRHSVHLRGN